MARYWTDGYDSIEQVGNPASYDVTVIDKARWDGKQDKLIFDNAPRLGSTRPVTSDGVAQAVNEAKEAIAKRGKEVVYIDVFIEDAVEKLPENIYDEIHKAYTDGRTLVLRFIDDADKCAYFYDFDSNAFRFVQLRGPYLLNAKLYWIAPDSALRSTVLYDIASREEIINKRTPGNTSGNLITIKNVDFAVKQALVDSTVDWTEDEKVAIRQLLNIVGLYDYPTTEKAGVVKVYHGNGVSCVDGQLAIVCATEQNIDERKQMSKPITPSNLDYAVRSALAYPKVAWSEEAQELARQTMGAIKNPKPANNALLGFKQGGKGEIETIGYTNFYPYAHQFLKLADESMGDEIQGTGYTLANTPTRPYHTANKKYVDDLFGAYIADIANLVGGDA